METGSRSQTLVVISYGMVYVVWGSTYFFIKQAVATIPPFYVVGLRFLVGGILLLLWAAAKGEFCNLTTKNVLHATGIGFLLLLGANGLVTIAEERVDSYIAALIVSTTPCAVLLTDRLFLRKPIRVSSLIGIALGFTGVMLLLYQGGSDHTFSLSIHMVLIFGAVTLWATGTSLSKRATLPSSVFSTSGIQLFTTGIVACSIALISKPTVMQTFREVSIVSWVSLLYLIVLGSLALVAYSYLLKHEPNGRIVTYAFVNPLIASALGIWLGKEIVVQHLVPALLCILGSLAFLFYSTRLLGAVESGDISRAQR